jgi:hypothetical protein
MKHPENLPQTPVDVRITFEKPDPTVIRLENGPALRAYYRWLEEPTWKNEQILADYLFEHCEDYILQWTKLEEWDALAP